MTQILNSLIAGISLGLVYALFAVGFNLVFGVMKAVNLAHAGVFMWSALVGVWVARAAGDLSALAALLVGGVIVGAALSLLTDLVVLRPIRRFKYSPEEMEMTTIVGTLGLFFIFEVGALVVTAARPVRYPAGTLDLGLTRVGGLLLQNKSLLAGAVAVVMITGLQLLLFRTKLGKAMRSVATNPELSRYLGIDINRVYVAALVLAGALGGVAGVLIGIMFSQVSYSMGHIFLLKGIVIIILGGMGNIPGTMFAALFVGITEALTVQFWGSNWRDVVIYAALLAVLIIKPHGIFGSEERLAT